LENLLNWLISVLIQKKQRNKYILRLFQILFVVDIMFTFYDTKFNHAVRAETIALTAFLKFDNRLLRG